MTAIARRPLLAALLATPFTGWAQQGGGRLVGP